MVLVFILCAVIILITLLICVTILSTIRLQINHFTMSNIKNREQEIFRQDDKKLLCEKTTQKYKIKISFYLFNKIKWFSIRLNDKKIRKMHKKIKLKDINFKKLEKDFKLEDLKEVKKLKPKISYFILNLKIGAEDVILTSFIIFAISTLVSVILPHTMKKYKKDKYKYEIIPLYINKNVYEIKFDCIIEVKMVHIINIVYVFLKKRRVDSNERTSNRRSYGYSYE